jgi:hypothetical protein
LADIHPQLENDCLILGKLQLCHVLLMRDANYPWCILVPDREDVTEIHHLVEADQQQLMRESVMLSRALETLFSPDKLNIGGAWKYCAAMPCPSCGTLSRGCRMAGTGVGQGAGQGIFARGIGRDCVGDKAGVVIAVARMSG